MFLLQLGMVCLSSAGLPAEFKHSKKVAFIQYFPFLFGTITCGRVDMKDVPFSGNHFKLRYYKLMMNSLFVYILKKFNRFYFPLNIHPIVFEKLVHFWLNGQFWLVILPTGDLQWLVQRFLASGQYTSSKMAHFKKKCFSFFHIFFWKEKISNKIHFPQNSHQMCTFVRHLEMVPCSLCSQQCM